MKGMELSVVPYARSAKMEVDDVEVDDETAENKPMVMNPKAGGAVKSRYRECMRNHAASIGGHANDGCGEFMPSSGGAGDSASLTCAACGCHRNFHRREVPGGVPPLHHHLMHSPPPHAHPMLLYNNTPSPKHALPHKFLGVPAFGGVDHHHPHHHHHHHQDDGERPYDRRSETPEREEVQMATTVATKNKRFRTKFTPEQKERMLELAEKLGWRIQKQDDVVLSQFCSEIGVKRNVLKVWMHNNKNAHRRREAPPQSPPSPPPSMVVAPPQAAVAGV